MGTRAACAGECFHSFFEFSQTFTRDTIHTNDTYTEAYQKHTDCSYAYKVVRCYDEIHCSYIHGKNVICGKLF